MYTAGYDVQGTKMHQTCIREPSNMFESREGGRESAFEHLLMVRTMMKFGQQRSSISGDPHLVLAQVVNH